MAAVWVVMVGSRLIDDASIHALNDQEAKQSYDISCYQWSLYSVI